MNAPNTELGALQEKSVRMKVQQRFIVFIFMVALMIGPAAVQGQRGPSTPDERQTAVKAARSLESDPLNKDAKKIRQWFTMWLIEIPDISVEVCGDYLGPVMGAKKDFDAEIFSQSMFSSTAFIIEHPDKSKDRVAVNQAGLEGSLKTYEAILRTKPKARWPYLDDLIAKRDKGELRAYVQEITDTKCIKK
jgi:hypothetical protein